MHRKHHLSLGAQTRGTALCKLVFLLALMTLLPGAKCPSIPELQDVEITLVAEDTIELVFEARGSINTHSSEEVIDISDLREDLLDAGFELAMLDSAWVTEVLYGVVAYNEGPTDRRIENGSVSVTWERGGASESDVLFDDVNVDVYPLLGMLEPAPIEAGGVDFVNDLLAMILQDLRAPDLATTFTVSADSEGDSEPGDRYTDFDWRVQIRFQIIGRIEVEVPRI